MRAKNLWGPGHNWKRSHFRSLELAHPDHEEQEEVGGNLEATLLIFFHQKTFAAGQPTAAHANKFVKDSSKIKTRIFSI